MPEFKTVQVDLEILAAAQRRNDQAFHKFGHMGTHRHDKKKQRETGFIAEAAIKLRLLPHFEFSTDNRYDLIFRGITFDVKAVGCNTEPLPGYPATLYQEQAPREVDWYIFGRVMNDRSMVFACGCIMRSAYLKAAMLVPAGARNSNFTYDNPRYELPYQRLHSIEILMMRGERR